MRIESPPLNDEHTNRDVDTDLDTDRAPWLGGTSRRASGFKSDQFRSDSLQNSRRIKRTLALFSVAVLIGICATLAWQMVGPWAARKRPSRFDGTKARGQQSRDYCRRVCRFFAAGTFQGDEVLRVRRCSTGFIFCVTPHSFSLSQFLLFN
jgi:hypothetical protein